jgi:hypothetical protein
MNQKVIVRARRIMTTTTIMNMRTAWKVDVLL